MRNQKDTEALEVAMNEDEYCHSCNQRVEYCCRKVYADCMKKKVFFIYWNTVVHPDSETVTEEIKDVYNKKCRVEYHNKFNFYDGAYLALPNCLYGFACELTHIVNELVECTKINRETREGIVSLI